MESADLHHHFYLQDHPLLSSPNTYFGARNQHILNPSSTYQSNSSDEFYVRSTRKGMRTSHLRHIHRPTPTTSMFIESTDSTSSPLTKSPNCNLGQQPCSCHGNPGTKFNRDYLNQHSQLPSYCLPTSIDLSMENSDSTMCFSSHLPFYNSMLLKSEYPFLSSNYFQAPIGVSTSNIKEANKGQGENTPLVKKSRPSCPPFRVRKEKLGDRIASLQQLVAPFGKTDTASVLMEAIGYIKFLQSQVQTLSVPYMKAAVRNKRVGLLHAGETDEPRIDLKSGGLCIVPLACVSFVSGEGCAVGGTAWPPNFYGGVPPHWQS